MIRKGYQITKSNKKRYKIGELIAEVEDSFFTSLDSVIKENQDTIVLGEPNKMSNLLLSFQSISIIYVYFMTILYQFFLLINWDFNRRP